VSSVLRPRQHSIGYMGDGFYGSKDQTNTKYTLSITKSDVNERYQNVTASSWYRVHRKDQAGIGGYKMTISSMKKLTNAKNLLRPKHMQSTQYTCLQQRQNQ